MNETQKTERANLYRTMMGLWAFKDFLEIMNHERQTALENSVISSKMEDVQICRGKVQCVDSLLSELDSIVNAR